jgi:L,D-transpeptidase ErfK/SrfK
MLKTASLKAMGRHHSLSHSFMVLSFATSALLIAVQWRGSPSSLKATASTAPMAHSVASQSNLDAQGAVAPNPPRTGIAVALQTSLNPDPLVQRSELIVDLSDRQVYLYQDGGLYGSYEIAVGKEGWETPTGKFSVINMQEHPIWQHPLTGELVPSGADNPLGARWIGFWSDGEHQIGFHGTNQEDLIGQAVSHGCIRMRNSDVEAIYAQVSIGTPVVVRP